MKKVLILQSTVLLHPNDMEAYRRKLQRDIDNSNVAIIPTWLKVVNIIGDEGKGIEVKIEEVTP